MYPKTLDKMYLTRRTSNKMIMWLFQCDFYIAGAINLKSCPPFFCDYFWHYVVPSVTFVLRNGFSFLVDIKKKLRYLLDKIRSMDENDSFRSYLWANGYTGKFILYCANFKFSVTLVYIFVIIVYVLYSFQKQLNIIAVLCVFYKNK